MTVQGRRISSYAPRPGQERQCYDDDVEISLRDGIQVIRFMRAAKKNAFTGAMYDAMSAALDKGETSPEIAVHVFIGSGGSFSAGNDINDYRRAHPPLGQVRMASRRRRSASSAACRA